MNRVSLLMSNTVLKLSIMIVIVGISGLFTAASDTLTLDDCIKYCMQNHPVVKQYKTLLKAQDERIKSDKVKIIPRINVEGGMGYNYLVFNYNIDDEDFLDIDDQQNNLDVYLKLNTSLLSGLHNIYDYQISGEDKHIVANDLYRTAKKLIYQIKLSYFNMLLYHEQIKIMDEIITRKEENIVLTQLLGKVEIQTTAILNIIKTEIERNKFKKEQFYHQLRFEKQRLLKIIGLEEGYDFNLDSYRDDNTRYDLEYILSNGLQKSLDLKNIDHEMNKNKLEIAAIDMKYIPELNVSASYSFGTTVEQNYTNTVLLDVSLSIPIVDYIVKHYQKEEIHKRYQSNSEKKQDVSTELESTLIDLFNNYAYFIDEKDILNKEYEALLKYYDILKSEYRRDKISYVILEGQEDKLFKLKMLREENVHDLRVARAKLEQAVKDITPLSITQE